MEIKDSDKDSLKLFLFFKVDTKQFLTSFLSPGFNSFITSASFSESGSWTKIERARERARERERERELTTFLF